MKAMRSRALRAIPFVLAMSGGSLALAASPYRGDAAPVSQASPSGQVVLQKMQAATQRSGSFHFAATVTISIPGVSNTSVSIDGDESTRNNAVHAFVTTKGAVQGAGAGLPAASRMEIVVVGKRYAQRTGSQPWQCQAATSVQPLLKSIVGAGKVGNPQNLGTRNVNGIPTWRVKARSRISFRGFQLAGPINFYVSQRDFTPVRVTARATIRSTFGNVSEREAITYSRYGVPVQVQLPPACAG